MSGVPQVTFGAFRRGFAEAQPLALGAMAYGALFGVLTAQAGLSVLEAGLMSAFVYSGSAQIAALQSWKSDAALVPMVLAILMINARYALYSAALRPWLGGVAAPKVYPTLFFLTDGGWLLALRRREEGLNDMGYLLGTGIGQVYAWVGGTILGNLIGGLVRDPGRFGVDFMLVAISAAMAVGLWRGRADIGRGGVALVVAVVATWLVPAGWVIVVAGFASAAWVYLTWEEEA